MAAIPQLAFENYLSLAVFRSRSTPLTTPRNQDKGIWHVMERRLMLSSFDITVSRQHKLIMDHGFTFGEVTWLSCTGTGKPGIENLRD